MRFVKVHFDPYMLSDDCIQAEICFLKISLVILPKIWSMSVIKEWKYLLSGWVEVNSNALCCKHSNMYLVSRGSFSH